MDSCATCGRSMYQREGDLIVTRCECWPCPDCGTQNLEQHKAGCARFPTVGHVVTQLLREVNAPRD